MSLTIRQTLAITHSLPPEQTSTTCKINIESYDKDDIIRKINDNCTSEPCLHYRKEIMSYIKCDDFQKTELADKFKYVDFHDISNDSILTIENSANKSDNRVAVRLFG